MEKTQEEIEALGVDYDVILDRFAGNMQLYASCLAMFAAEDKTAEIERAFATRDFAALERLAHAAKGTSATMGLDALSGLCGTVVQAVRENRLDDIDAQVSAMLDAYRAVLAALD